jgi:hypothetical protein
LDCLGRKRLRRLFILLVNILRVVTKPQAQSFLIFSVETGEEFRKKEYNQLGIQHAASIQKKQILTRPDMISDVEQVDTEDGPEDQNIPEYDFAAMGFLPVDHSRPEEELAKDEKGEINDLQSAVMNNLNEMYQTFAIVVAEMDDETRAKYRIKFLSEVSKELINMFKLRLLYMGRYRGCE